MSVPVRTAMLAVLAVLAMPAVVLFVFVLLHSILDDTAHNGTANCSENAVVSLMAGESSSESSGECSTKTAFSILTLLILSLTRPTLSIVGAVIRLGRVLAILRLLAVLGFLLIIPLRLAISRLLAVLLVLGVRLVVGIGLTVALLGGISTLALVVVTLLLTVLIVRAGHVDKVGVRCDEG